MKHFPSSKSLFWSSLIIFFLSLISPLFTVSYESFFRLFIAEPQEALMAAFNLPFKVFVLSLVVLGVAIARLIIEQTEKSKLGTQEIDSNKTAESNVLKRKLPLPTTLSVLIWVILGVVLLSFLLLMSFSMMFMLMLG